MDIAFSPREPVVGVCKSDQFLTLLTTAPLANEIFVARRKGSAGGRRPTAFREDLILPAILLLTSGQGRLPG